MNKNILALKYRPKFFNEVIGQDFCVQALSNSITLNKIHNAYLFSGTRGVGKTTIARIFAKSLLCEKGISESPCGKCESCIGIDNNNNLDLIEIDAASRTKVEDTRVLMENVQYAPSSSRFKIYLIDEVHMLSTKSFNALLKTIEEPPEHVKFLLATTDPDKLPETVISRCLHFKLESISNETLTFHIEKTLTKENISFESNTPRLIADAARGSARDSMSILEQCISYCNGDLTDKEISNLLGIIDQTIVDNIILALYSNSYESIHNLLENSEINNYLRLLDNLIERIFQISTARMTDNKDLPKELINSSLTLDNLQLWYSLLIQSKSDFDTVPSKKDHLLMILMRIILFTEYPEEIKNRECKEKSTLDIEPKKKDKSNSLSGEIPNQHSIQSWKSFVHNQKLSGLMLDLAQNSIIENNRESTFLLIDNSKKNTYPQKCIEDFTKTIIQFFNITNGFSIDYRDDLNTLYKISVSENIKSKEDMYDSIKDNNVVKEIESVFDAKIDKENISKL